MRGSSGPCQGRSLVMNRCHRDIYHSDRHTWVEPDWDKDIGFNRPDRKIPNSEQPAGRVPKGQLLISQAEQWSRGSWTGLGRGSTDGRVDLPLTHAPSDRVCKSVRRLTRDTPAMVVEGYGGIQRRVIEWMGVMHIWELAPCMDIHRLYGYLEGSNILFKFRYLNIDIEFV